MGSGWKTSTVRSGQQDTFDRMENLRMTDQKVSSDWRMVESNRRALEPGQGHDTDQKTGFSNQKALPSDRRRNGQVPSEQCAITGVAAPRQLELQDLKEVEPREQAAPKGHRCRHCKRKPLAYMGRWGPSQTTASSTGYRTSVALSQRNWTKQRQLKRPRVESQYLWEPPSEVMPAACSSARGW